MAAAQHDEAARLLDEWRRTVNAELAETARLHAQAAVTFERVNSRLDEHDRRLTTLEQAPAARRAERRDSITLDYRFYTIMLALGALIVSIFHPTIVFH